MSGGRIYKQNLIDDLKELSSREIQENIWLDKNNPDRLISSFIEASNRVFDDNTITYLLDNNEIIFNKKITKLFIELDIALSNIEDDYRPDEEIIADPAMIIVRKKALQILNAIEGADISDNTVEIL